MTPEERGEKAASLKKSGTANCCHFLSLKGRDTGRVLCECPECCRNAVLAWVMRYDDFVVPIPGMRKEERVAENLGATDVELSDAEYAAINDALAGIAIYGCRDGKDIKKLGTVPENVDK